MLSQCSSIPVVFTLLSYFVPSQLKFFYFRIFGNVIIGVELINFESAEVLKSAFHLLLWINDYMNFCISFGTVPSLVCFDLSVFFSFTMSL